MTDSMKNNDVKESEIKEKKNMGESVKGMAKSIGSKNQRKQYLALLM